MDDDSIGEDALHEAAAEGRVEDIPRLLRAAGRLLKSKALDPEVGLSVTPLHVAADGATVRALLAAGARTHWGPQGWTPLHQAAHDGRVDAARALLDAGAELERTWSKTGETPLHRAALEGHADVVRLLLERGAKVEAAAAQGTRPLHHASTVDVMEALLGAGANPEARDALGATPLDFALQRGDAASVARLESVGAPRSQHRLLQDPEQLQRGLVMLTLLGVPVLTPSVVIGYSLYGLASIGSSVDAACVGLAGSLPHPSWWVEVDQQAGGYSMSYPGFLGLMLRLEANAGQALQEPTRLIRGFRAMAEDPDYALLEREYPRLHACTGTSGEQYTRQQLSLLHQEVSAVFPVPAFDSGLEACVQFEETDLLRAFGGWRVLGVRIPPEAELFAGKRLCDELNAAELRLDEDTSLTHDVLRSLRAWGQRFLGQKLPPLRAYLLWENSD